MTYVRRVSALSAAPLLFRSGFDNSVHVPRWTDDAFQARAVDHLHNQPLMYLRDYLVSHLYSNRGTRARLRDRFDDGYLDVR